MKPKYECSSTLHRLGVLLVTGLGLLSCVGPEEPYKYDPPATEVLRIEQFPDTLVMGDTLFIRCVVKDSLDPNLKYNWALGSERFLPVNGKTDSSVIRWHVGNLNLFENKPDSVRVTTVNAGVSVSRFGDFSEVSIRFNMIIKRKN